MMPPFAHARADDLGDALRLAAEEKGARLLAGATDLVTVLKRRLERPSLLVDLKRVRDPALRAIVGGAKGGLAIGALVTLAEIERSPAVHGDGTGPHAALAEACAAAATPQIRNVATIGGNLCQSPRCWYWRDGFPCLLHGGDRCHAAEGDARFHAIFADDEQGERQCVDVQPSDPATALVALDAGLDVVDAAGARRELKVADHFRHPTRERPSLHGLAPGEAIVAVRLPPAPEGRVSVHEKAMARAVWTFALASVAVAASYGPGRRLERVRLVLGGVAAVPLRAPAAERALEGRDPRDAAVRARAADEAVRGALPHRTNAYKVALVRGLVGRAIERLAGATPG